MSANVNSGRCGNISVIGNCHNVENPAETRNLASVCICRFQADLSLHAILTANSQIALKFEEYTRRDLLTHLRHQSKYLTII